MDDINYHYKLEYRFKGSRKWLNGGEQNSRDHNYLPGLESGYNKLRKNEIDHKFEYEYRVKSDGPHAGKVLAYLKRVTFYPNPHFGIKLIDKKGAKPKAIVCPICKVKDCEHIEMARKSTVKINPKPKPRPPKTYNEMYAAIIKERRKKKNSTVRINPKSKRKNSTVRINPNEYWAFLVLINQKYITSGVLVGTKKQASNHCSSLVNSLNTTVELMGPYNSKTKADAVIKTRIHTIRSK